MAALAVLQEDGDRSDSAKAEDQETTSATATESESEGCGGCKIRTRKAIAKETMDILEIAMQGEDADTDLPEVLMANPLFTSAVSAAVVGSSMQLEQDGRRGLPRQPNRGPFQVEFTDETTVASIFRLSKEGCHVAALNFASATNPGGGFLGGADAQEESLARSSGLYPCLARFQDSYYSLPINGGLYTHGTIFSPHVPFFRGDDGELRPPCLASVVTSPAVNFKRIRDPGVARKTHAIMKERARRVFHLAAAEAVDILILGAWGCGVFAGSPIEMADIFKDLVTDPKFRHIRCVFAIPDSNVRTQFSAVFAGCAPHGVRVDDERSGGRMQRQPDRKWKGKPYQTRGFREYGDDGL
eukprot:TRINITY_DN27168_c0_g1_i1.p1 TRINITY_DN27168_c0_g1~~TRINITY_DN27168_c0_g1_i1.p1  ORF type:complete len:380 (-),score=48.59 TRINITY_DN27168_c0_g1_i1:756-1823(-)